jgi:Zn-dependent peptidase ImmA (M78 family)/DNA-binding XRE family transcriptional regulator
MFNPNRLTVARKRRGFTMTRLAQLLGVELRTVSAYESGEFAPSEATLEKIAQELNFPISFFSQDDLEEISPDSASFRAMTKMSASKRDIALYSGSIALLLNNAIESRFVLPEINLPDLSRELDPEAASDALRRHWGLGEAPIKNVVHLLEAQGVRVFSLCIDAVEVDAFSLWRESRPFVFLNTKKSAERARFDCAHELGHLAIHRHGSLQGEINGSQEIEKEANEFASAFLMPRGSVLAYAPKFVTVESLVRLKKIWGVSVAALAYRMHRLNIITDWHYRELFKQIAKLGYRKDEPDSAPHETSQILQKVFSALRNEGIDKSDIASEIHVSREDIDELVFGLILSGIKSGHALKTQAVKPKGRLRLIKS